MRYYVKLEDPTEIKRDSIEVCREKFFLNAIKEGCLTQIKEWVELGVNIKSKTLLQSSEEIPLLYLTKDPNIAEYLIKLGVDINEQKIGGKTLF